MKNKKQFSQTNKSIPTIEYWTLWIDFKSQNILKTKKTVWVIEYIQRTMEKKSSTSTSK